MRCFRSRHDISGRPVFHPLTTLSEYSKSFAKLHTTSSIILRSISQHQELPLERLLSLPLKHPRHNEHRAQLIRRRILLPPPILLFHIHRLPPSPHNAFSQPLHILCTNISHVHLNRSVELLLIQYIATSLAGYFSSNQYEKIKRMEF